MVDNTRERTKQLDQLAREFETAWRKNRIQAWDFLNNAPPGLPKTEVIKELVQVEISLRVEAGEKVEAIEYSPIDPDWIQHLIAHYSTAYEDPTKSINSPFEESGVVDATLAFETPKENDDESAEGTGFKGLDGYEIISEIARGGMGVVYRARQTKLNRLVALKMIRSGEFAGKEEIKRFEAEAEAAARIDHPGIVPIFEIGEYEGNPFFSMALIEGESLGAKLQKGPLQPRHAAELIKKIAEAIAFAHEKGVIHRDLKPANILVDSNGTPKVTDFGLAKNLGGDSELTGTGQILGTPSYMPPEQAAGNTLQVDERADVYALGAILYCMLVNRAPFQAATPMDTLKQVLEREPVSPRTLDPKIPRDIETICLKAMRKERGDRYSSAHSLALDIDNWLTGKPIRAKRVGNVEKATKWARRNPVITGAFLITIVIIIVSAFSLSSIQQNYNDQLMKEAVTNLQTANDAGIPFAIAQLKDFNQDKVLSELESRKKDEVGGLAVNCALSMFGEDQSEFLINDLAAESLDSTRFELIFEALRLHAANAIPRLIELAEQADLEANWVLKSKLAIMCLRLKDFSLADEMLDTSAGETGLWDPTQRATFVSKFSIFCGSLNKVSMIISKVVHPSTRSGLCLAFGNATVVSDQERELFDLIKSWYVNDADGGVHSASNWLLAKWNILLPEIASRDGPLPQIHWWNLPKGPPMVRIPAGPTFLTEVNPRSRDAYGHVVARFPFWISRREVTFSEFELFVEGYEFNGVGPSKGDLQTILNRAKSDHKGYSVKGNSNRLPITGVPFYVAVQYCNWLSKQHGLKPYYDITDFPGRESKLFANKDFIVRPTENANGFRLPDSEMWSTACLAGASTKYAFGDDLTFVNDYVAKDVVVYEEVESRMCNPLGVFNMHGNVREWLEDEGDAINRGRREGGWTAGSIGSTLIPGPRFRSRDDRFYDHNQIGFRVALPDSKLELKPNSHQLQSWDSIRQNREETRTNSLGMKFVLVNPGSFKMSTRKRSTDPVEQVEIKLSKPFYLGMHEVTQDQFERVLGFNPSRFKSSNSPVENVTWIQASEYCRKLSLLEAEQKAGFVYRLPTDAEWLLASIDKFSSGKISKQFDDLKDFAWHDGNSDSKTHPVGTKKPNVRGLYDTRGNVWEWTMCIGTVPLRSAGWQDKLIDPIGPSGGTTRNIAGGGWDTPSSHCSVMSFVGQKPDTARPNIGFRVVMIPYETE